MTVPSEESSSLLDWATGLVTDPALRSRFAAEPRAVLDEQGLTEVPPADLHHSLPLVTDSVAARVGVELDATAVSGTTHLAGETAADALARHLGSAVDLVAADLDALPDPSWIDAPDDGPGVDDTDPDLGDTDIDDLEPLPDATTPDHPVTPETTTMTTTPESFSTDEAAQAHNRQLFLDQKAAFNHFGSTDAFVADADMADDGFMSLYSDYDVRNDYGAESYAEHRVSHETHLADDPDYTYPGEASTPAALDVDPDLDDLDGSGSTTGPGDIAPTSNSGDTPDGQWADESAIPRWISRDESQHTWYDNGDRSDIVDGPVNPTDPPGTPQGWHTLTLEAQSNGFPDAQAYLADPQFSAPEFRQDVGWEPGNRSAPYGELQAYFDAADAAGVSPADYGAANTYTPEQIDAAYAAADDSADAGQDTDLDDLDGATGPDDPETAIEPYHAPGTPQAWLELQQEATSAGYPSAEAYLADPELQSMRGVVGWEPGVREAAYGQLQAFQDAAVIAGVSPSEYGADHSFTEAQIDAAFQAEDDAADAQYRADNGLPPNTDPDGLDGPDSLDDLGPVPGPEGGMLGSWPEDPNHGLPAQGGGDVDLDGFGASASDVSAPSGGAGDVDLDGFGASASDVSAPSGGAGDVDLDGFGTSASDVSAPSGASDGGESFGSGSSDGGSSSDAPSDDSASLDDPGSSDGSDAPGSPDSSDASDSGSAYDADSDAGGSDDAGSDAGSDDGGPDDGGAADDGGESF